MCVCVYMCVFVGQTYCSPCVGVGRSNNRGREGSRGGDLEAMDLGGGVDDLVDGNEEQGERDDDDSFKPDRTANL